MKLTIKGCKVETHITEHQKSARIKPKGFWSDMVRVSQTTSFRDGAWEDPEISWSCGGTDGTLSNLEATQYFINALVRAQEIAKEWAVSAKKND